MNGLSKKAVPETIAQQEAAGVPVVILSGFLGSGKTSLLNHLLDNPAASKVAVIVNDFGDIGIDAKLIKNADSIIELSGGCICCKTTGDFRQAVTRVLESKYAIDILFIETSGLADPSVLAAYVSELSVITSLRLSGVVTVIDALNFDRNLEIAEVAFQQLSAADLFVVNKCDMVEPQRLSLIEQALLRINKDAPALFTIDGVMLREELFQSLQHHKASHATDEISGHHHNHSAPFMSAVVRTALPLDRQKFENWLGDLPSGVLRAKGLLYFNNMAAPQLLQLVGVDRKLTPAEATNLEENTEIVLIGLDLDQQRLQLSLERCAYKNA